MDLKHNEHDGIHILQLTGRLDAFEIGLVSHWLEENTPSENPRIIINMSGVSFIDSTALAALVRGMKHCRQSNGDLYLCCLQQPVLIIFELTRLDRAFSIFEQQEDAIKAFNE